jgi:hypothetical protein
VQGRKLKLKANFEKRCIIFQLQVRTPGGFNTGFNSFQLAPPYQVGASQHILRRAKVVPRYQGRVSWL